jgi:hypothetical protein
VRIPLSLNVSRSVRALGLAAAMIPLAASSAFAYHQTAQTGSVGHYSWTDDATHPAAKCSYQGAAGSLYFDGVRVKAPVAYWPDQDSNVSDEHGDIGWRTVIQHFNGATWDVVKKGPEVRMPASETTAAAFAAQKVNWPGPNSRRYRAAAILTWWLPDGVTKLGRAWVQIDFHRRAYDGSVGSSCVGRHQNIH